LPVGRGPRAQTPKPPSPVIAPSAFLRIAPNNTVTVLCKHLEFGQGPMTGLATLVAEELDADWGQIRGAEAPGNAALYANLEYAPLQMTGGSSATSNSYEQMRKVGAAARAMLVAAAADAWGVPEAEISVAKGVISHTKTGQSAQFGAFADAAAKLPVPENPRLKDPSMFTLIGRENVVKRLDTPDKTRGKAVFTMDLHVPGMLTAVLARPPLFGAKAVSLDDAAARAVKGVIDIKILPMGVAIYADATWPAIKARRLLKVVWDDSSAEKRSTEQMLDELRAKAATPGRVANQHGDPARAMTGAARVVETEYLFPHLAHSPMEPLDGLMVWVGTRIRAKLGSQAPTLDQGQISQIFGVTADKVDIEVVIAGGSFGRRPDIGNDFVAELAHATKAIGQNRPVKLVWTREDDIQAGFYRPLVAHKLRAAVDGGRIVGWSNTIAGQSFLVGSIVEGFMKDGVDPMLFEGASELPYDLPNFRCDFHIVNLGVPTTSFRSVGSTHTTYATECFMDELLQLMGKDPVAGRLELITKSPRHAGVLKAVAELAAWTGPKVGNDRGRGVAVAKAFNTYIAQIAEVSVGANGEPRVQKVWCAVDCGVVVNPDIVRAQMEGGIGFGLGHILYAEVPIKDGRVVPKNFDQYRSLRINEMPEITVEIVASTEKPTGVGELGVPCIGPAVANALAALGQERPRRLPMVRAPFA
jgi:isoquinoline 1-oxidoreductase beta subunit